jgi:hypothetical protein
MTEPIHALAVGARNEGRTKTAEEWIHLLGGTLFETARRRELLIGPSGTNIARCQSCTQPGHSAPATPSEIRGIYEVFCEEAGVFTIPAASVEGFHVSEQAFLDQVAAAFGVVRPEEEFVRIADHLYYLGTSYFGKRPFSLIAALSLRTDMERRDLERRNREGFAKEPGLILGCDPYAETEQRSGFHAFRLFSEIVDFGSEGFQPRWSEVRRVLGLPGRPADRKSQTAEAQKVFENILDEEGSMPRGEAAFRLFRLKSPDLCHLSSAALYDAKSRAIKAHARRTKLSTD